MIRNTLLAFVLASSATLAGEAADTTSQAQLERRFEVLSTLRSGRFSTALPEALFRAVPSNAVLSRVTFAAGTGELGFVLSAGKTAEADAIARAVSTVPGAVTIAATQSSQGVYGLVTFKPHLTTRTLRAATTARQTDPNDERILREKRENAQTELPDVPRLEHRKAFVDDLFARFGVSAGASVLTGPVTMGPVDVFELSLSGSTGFDGAWALIVELSNMRRLALIDAFELKEPRLRNGEWAVTFSVRAKLFRYRVEEELEDQVLAISTFEDSNSEFLPLTRNPFGPPAPVFAGSAKVPPATACRTEAGATPIGKVELDALAVVYLADGVAPRCAMLVDDTGGCHLLNLNDRVESIPGAKVAHIDSTAISIVRYQLLPDGKKYPKTIALKVATTAKPPTGFCKGK